jgi:hypothetical protein
VSWRRALPEQIIRPTGLPTSQIEIRLVDMQVDICSTKCKVAAQECVRSVPRSPNAWLRSHRIHARTGYLRATCTQISTRRAGSRSCDSRPGALDVLIGINLLREARYLNASSLSDADKASRAGDLPDRHRAPRETQMAASSCTPTASPLDGARQGRRRRCRAKQLASPAGAASITPLRKKNVEDILPASAR